MTLHLAGRCSHVTLLLLLIAQPVRADEPAIRAALRDFLRTDDAARRQALARQIEADPVYDRAKVRDWLHQADLWQPLPAGRRTLTVPLADGTSRPVALRIPAAYDCRRPWPLIYALHGMSGDGDGIVRYVEHILGPAAEEFVIAAPTSYGDKALHDPQWPPTAEHPTIWLRLRQTVHIDSDRVFLTGYSMGGHVTWTLGVLYADQFAGLMPIAGTFILPVTDGLYETLLPNVARVPVLAVWGADDIYGPDGQPSPDGGIAGVNRKVRTAAQSLSLSYTGIELAGVGHGDVVPPADELKKLLGARRTHYPATVRHTFRHVVQSSAYWFEAHALTGKVWGAQPPAIELREGENPMNAADCEAAAARAYRGVLATLEGEVSGQEIRVRRRKVKELTVWIGDGMIDWSQPVTLRAGGRKPDFEGRIEPSLYICLSQAARTWDFDRLRWAGFRVRSGSKTRPITPETTFPTIAELVAREAE